MITLLVERYWTATTFEGFVPEATVDGRQAPVPGVTHVGSILVPADETLFSLFDAVSLDVVRDAHERRQAPFERIVECTSTFSATTTTRTREEPRR